MAVELDWSKINGSSSKGGKTQNNGSNSGFKPLNFLVLGRRALGKTFVVRPVGKPVGFYKATVRGADGRTKNIYVDVDENGGDSRVRSHPLSLGHNLKFSIRYAINIIDRSDNQLKILEGGPSIFGPLHSYWEMTEKQPGGPSGADFEINVTGKKGKDYYEVTKVAKTPFTQEEVQYIKSEGLFKVDQVFKETPQEKWKAWVGEVEDGKDLNVDFSNPNKSIEKKEEVASSNDKDKDENFLSMESDSSELDSKEVSVDELSDEDLNF